MRSCITIRGYVRPSLRPSVRPSVGHARVETTLKCRFWTKLLRARARTHLMPCIRPCFVFTSSVLKPPAISVCRSHFSASFSSFVTHQRSCTFESTYAAIGGTWISVRLRVKAPFDDCQSFTVEFGIGNSETMIILVKGDDFVRQDLQIKRYL